MDKNSFLFLCTPARALDIQWEQICWYGQRWGVQDLSEAMALMTDTVTLGEIDHHDPVYIGLFSHLVPRGGSFDGLFSRMPAWPAGWWMSAAERAALEGRS